MGITQVDPRETEGFDEGLDLECVTGRIHSPSWAQSGRWQGIYAVDYSTIQYILEVMNYRNPRGKEQLPTSSLLTLGHLCPLPHRGALGQYPLQTLQFPQNLPE